MSACCFCGVLALCCCKRRRCDSTGAGRAGGFGASDDTTQQAYRQVSRPGPTPTTMICFEVCQLKPLPSNCEHSQTKLHVHGAVRASRNRTLEQLKSTKPLHFSLPLSSLSAGTIPPELGRLSNLQVLHLANNYIAGKFHVVDFSLCLLFVLRFRV